MGYTLGMEVKAMPWRITDVLDERVRFIALYLQHKLSMADLCKSFEISRKTGYKFVRRYEAFGPQGLHDLRSVPHHQPHAVSEAVQELIVALRASWPSLGPKKLRAALSERHPDTVWPAASTIGEILKRAGLLTPRKHHRHAQPSLPSSLAVPSAPQRVIAADFKGQFPLANGQPCFTLTVSDLFSRMLLRCQALARPGFNQVYPVFVALFREHGLPEVIRTDNGAPFASCALGGLSRLAVWWIKLGIRPERIQPGHPEQNGSHERMHRTLKEEAATPPAANLAAQQRAFDRFLERYNYLRPHEALGQKTPAAFYTPSPRPYPLRLPRLEYPAAMKVRRVRHDGCIRWHGRMLFVSETLSGEPVGLDALDDRLCALHFGPLPLAVLDDQTNSWLPAKRAAQIIQNLRQEDAD
jgi:transposase InsO family protein